MIVDTEKVLREADGSVKLVAVRPHTDGKVFAPGCASKPDGESREEPEEHKRTIGISMGLETCLILGQVSHNLLYGKKSSRRKNVVRGEIDEKAAYIQARSSMARALEINGKASQAEGEAKVV